MHRILHVVEAIETGVIRHVLDIVDHVDAEHHVALPPRRHGGMTDETAVTRLGAVAQTHRLDMRRSALSVHNLAAIAHLRRLVGVLAPTVVHGHSTVGGAVARLAVVGTGVPALYTPNGLSSRPPVRVVERMLAPLTAVLIAVSPSEADEAREATGRRGRLRIAVVPNGIDPHPPPPAAPGLRARLGLTADVPLVGTVGRLTEQKDPFTMLAAWDLVAARHADVHFVWMGDGDLGPAVRAGAADHSDRIHLLGHVPDAGACVAELDVFAMASTYEGGPYAPLEAMRAGVPVVATDVTGTRDCVAAGHTGLLVPAGDPSALANAIGEVLADTGGSGHLVDAAARRLATEFSIATMAGRLSDVYDRFPQSRTDRGVSGPIRRRSR